MTVGVPIESNPGERRVALVPASVPGLIQAGIEVRVESGAGEKAGFTDAAYKERGALISLERADLFSSSDLILKVNGLGANPDAGYADLELTRSDQILIGFLNPLGAPNEVKKLAEKGVTAFALEFLPRIGRAQQMDALSSMATIAGYKAVLLGAAALRKMVPMMITAAGTITPARAFVVGAGVAGLQAIATARRLGAIVQSYDVRPAVKEQVESLGAKFLDLTLDPVDAETSGGYAKALGDAFYLRQREMMKAVVAESDLVITTAAIPGKKAPILITEEMVRGMQPGSVIIDLAAEGGGNCELTRAGETIDADGVSILGPINLPATVPFHASQMYSKNVTTFVQNLMRNGGGRIDTEDQIIRDTLLTHKGKVANPRVRELLDNP